MPTAGAPVTTCDAEREKVGVHHVVTLDEHGSTISDAEFDHYADAGIRYCHIVLRQPGVHVQWVEGEALPDLPPKILAQRFGSPCDEPCCVPLAEPWPEQDPASQLVMPTAERERRA